jgi:serine/threonine-protein kinase
VAEDTFRLIEQMPDGDEKSYLRCLARGNIDLLRREYASALRAADATNDAWLQQKPDGLVEKYLIIGIARKGLHDEPGAREAFSKLKEVAQARVTADPDNPDAGVRLALALAFLGEKDPALAEADRALALLPVSKDSFHGPDILEVASHVYVLTGEKDRAFRALTELANRPSPISAALLKLNPIWDPVRDDPRFEEIVNKLSAKT